MVRLDPVLGSRIGKTRPDTVVSNDINDAHADTVTVVPVTSNVDKVYPFEVLISSREGGLNNDSKAKANQIRTVDKKRLFKYTGAISRERLKELERAIHLHLGLEVD